MVCYQGLEGFVHFLELLNSKVDWKIKDIDGEPL